MPKQVKALVLLSGGLDSILAVKLLLEQGIEVQAINFRTNFCGPSKARKAAEMLGVKLREVNIREEFLPILKNPRHGYGVGLNPCIDCHALMLKKAGEIMRAEGFDLVATGEVLGERPMSQHKQALDIVEKDADLKGYLLRPLSAKLLEPTIAEQSSLVDREKLLAISGRSRKTQMALAAQYGLKDYPSPAGGCALTQKDFAMRLEELMDNKSDFTPEDVDLVAVGRHFWLEKETLRQAQRINKLLPERSEAKSKASVQIILGRSQEENEILVSVAKGSDILIVPDGWPGPTALVRPILRSRTSQDWPESATEEVKKKIIQFSSKAKNLKPEEIRFKIIKAV